MSETSSIGAYPLTWPESRPRTPPWRRKRGAFKERSFGLIRDELLDELRRLGAREIIVSSNIPTRGDGLPYAGTREPDDGGIAVYFTRNKKPYVIACDTYDRTWRNLRAIAVTIEALRAIERHAATEIMEQAFTGFLALPPARVGEPSWWEVLGVAADAPLDAIEEAHRRLTEQHHPDVGGQHEQMARINCARDVARQERGA